MAAEPLGVIFDVDGVLVDSYQAHFDAWGILGRERGFEISEEMFARSFGRTSREAMVEIFGMRDLSGEQIAELDLAKEAKYRELLADAFPELAGAGELIDALHADGFRLAAGSSGPPPNVDLAVDQLHRRDKFQALVTGDDVTQGKPHPQVFLLAAEKLGLPPERCCVIEDAPAGIEAAHRAGMPCVAVTSTGRTAEEQSAADLIVATLSDVTPAMIRRLIEGNNRIARP